MRSVILVLPALVLAATPAAAVDDFLKGKVYAPSDSDCATLEADGSLEESGYITSEGFQAYEFTCHFIDAKAMTDPRPGWFVDALCEMPGETYPDAVSLFPLDETTLQVTFLTDFARAEMAAANGSAGSEAISGDYVLCRNVTADALASPPE
jgi:hypothetical protein